MTACIGLITSSWVSVFSSIKRNKDWVCAIAQQVKILAAKPDDLKLILQTRMMEGES